MHLVWLGVVVRFSQTPSHKPAGETYGETYEEIFPKELTFT